MPDIPWSNSGVFIPRGWATPDSTLVGLDSSTNAQFTPQAGYKYIVVGYASTADVAATYDNGTAGVGATLTATSNGVLAMDGGNPAINTLVLVKDQTNTFENGVYVVTDPGTAGNPFVLTRYTGFDEDFEIPVGIKIKVVAGTVNANSNLQQTATVATIGTDPITFGADQEVSGGLKSVQVFTSGGTWTKPSGITNVLVNVIGAGGGGGGSNGAAAAGAGGGGGGAAIEFIDVTGTASETVTVGAGGSGGSTSGGNGTAGGTSSFGAFCSATGGGGGTGSTVGSVAGTAGGSGSGGDVNITGGAGTRGSTSSGGGDGGESILGGTGLGAQDGNGSAGGNYGGAGGGAWGTAHSGGAGAGGIVIVYEYS